MTDDPRPALRIRTLTDLLEVVPGMLGFHPTDSLVLIVLDGPRVALTARADLGERPGDLVHQFRPVWRRFPHAELMAVAYTTDASRAWAALDALDDAAPPGALRSALHADGRHWRRHPDDEGTPYDDTTGPLAVRAVVEGMAVLPSRADLEAALEPARTPAQVEAALDRLGARALDAPDVVGEALALLEAVDRSPRVPDDDEAALLTLASHVDEFRQAAILSTHAGNARARRELWLGAIRAAAPRSTGCLLVLLGLAAWVAGEGALLVVCLERLSGRATDAAWASFLNDVNARVVPPAEWEQIRADRTCDALQQAGQGRP